MPLAMFVVANAEPSMSRASPDTARPYRNIFASYSHRDVGVVEEFDTVIETLGDRYLRDARDLRAGQVWSGELERLIERADVFQLFWSWNALASPFVQKEWEFALRLQRSNFIRPVYWEEPLPERGNLPPETLRRLHFHRLRRSEAHTSTETASIPIGEIAYAPARASGPALPAPAKKPWVVRAAPMLTAAAATILVATIAWPLLTTLGRRPPGQTDLPSTSVGGSPTVADPKPSPSPNPPVAVVRPPMRPSGRIRIPRNVLAGGRPLSAGNYELALTNERGAGSEAPSEHWVEFRRNGRVIGREIAGVISASEVTRALKTNRPKTGQARVSLVKGDDYMRVWINQSGTYYVVRLPVR